MFGRKKALGIIRENLLVKGDKGEEKITVLFDSGASGSFIKSEIARKISTPIELRFQREFRVADGHKVSCKHFCDLSMEIGGKRIAIGAFLIDDLPAPLIFGALDMEAYMIRLDLAKRNLDLSEFTGYMLALCMAMRV